MDSPRNVTINITTGTIVKAILLVVLFYVMYMVRDVVMIVLAAVVIASAIEPMTKWLGRQRIQRVPAVIIVYLFLALMLMTLTFFFLPTLLNELSTYMANAPRYLDYVQVWLPSGGTDIVAGSQKVQEFSSTVLSVKENISTIASAFGNVSNGFVQTISIVFGGIFSFILIVVLSFYLAVQEDGVANFLRIIAPKKYEPYVVGLWKRSQIKIGLWMQGQLILCLTVGVLVFLSLMVLGVKHAILLALLAAAFEIIPIFGPILSAIPAILIGFDSGGLGMALVIAGLYAIIQQFENHLFYPLVVKKIVGVSPIVVILALIIGAKLAGFLGVLLAVPLSTMLMEYYSDVEKDKLSTNTPTQSA